MLKIFVSAILALPVVFAAVIPVDRFDDARRTGEIAPERSVRVRVVYYSVSEQPSGPLTIQICYRNTATSKAVVATIKPRGVNRVWETYMPSSGSVTFEASFIKDGLPNSARVGPINLAVIGRMFSFKVNREKSGIYTYEINQK